MEHDDDDADGAEEKGDERAEEAAAKAAVTVTCVVTAADTVAATLTVTTAEADQGAAAPSYSKPSASSAALATARKARADELAYDRIAQNFSRVEIVRRPPSVSWSVGLPAQPALVIGRHCMTECVYSTYM